MSKLDFIAELLVTSMFIYTMTIAFPCYHHNNSFNYVLFVSVTSMIACAFSTFPFFIVIINDILTEIITTIATLICSILILVANFLN